MRRQQVEIGTERCIRNERSAQRLLRMVEVDALDRMPCGVLAGPNMRSRHACEKIPSNVARGRPYSAYLRRMKRAKNVPYPWMSFLGGKSFISAVLLAAAFVRGEGL